MRTLPSASIRERISLPRRTLTLCRALSHSHFRGSVSSPMARRTSSVISLMWPSAPPARVDSTAPQWVCPSTRIRGTFRCSAAYSAEPSSKGPMTLPALRMTNRLPSPTEKMCSGGTRESPQVMTAA